MTNRDQSQRNDVAAWAAFYAPEPLKTKLPFNRSRTAPAVKDRGRPVHEPSRQAVRGSDTPTGTPPVNLPHRQIRVRLPFPIYDKAEREAVIERLQLEQWGAMHAGCYGDVCKAVSEPYCMGPTRERHSVLGHPGSGA